MHYKNGREAKEGDKILVLSEYGLPLVGVLHSTTAESDTCNGKVSPLSPNDQMVTINDCLHVDDVLAASIPDSTK